MDAGRAGDPEPLPVVRGCDGCTLCCKVLAVTALAKPLNTWCPHCKVGGGCGIYETRPPDCRTFHCGYLVMPHLGPEWKPAVSHLIISSEGSYQRLTIHVDQARPDAWRRQPYYALIKEWSRKALSERKQVVIKVGQRSIMLLPDRNVDLGVMDDDEQIAIDETPSTNGVVYDVYAVKVDSPAWQTIAAADGGSVAVGAGTGPEFRKARTIP
jgi:hypothetical protein